MTALPAPASLQSKRLFENNVHSILGTTERFGKGAAVDCCTARRVELCGGSAVSG